jgi:hypothetical protein
MSYFKKLEKLLGGVHLEVKNLLDPEKQKRSFPKKALAGFLKKKKISEKIEGSVPEEISTMTESKEKRVPVPSEALRTFFTDQDIWDLLPESVRKAIEGDRDPRLPNQATSDFAIHRELGDWAEREVLGAVNEAAIGFKAVQYGRTDRLLAGEKGSDLLFREHHAELKTMGKRPDLLLYTSAAAPVESFAGKKAADLTPLAKKAIAAFEVRASQQAIKTDARAEKLSFTPKIEDIYHVVRWIQIHEVPHFYVQVFFGRVYAIPFAKILKVLKDPPSTDGYRIAQLARNQFKSTIYIPLSEGVLLSSNFEAPTKLTASTEELTNGRIVVVVKFADGKITLNKEALTGLLGDSEE